MMDQGDVLGLLDRAANEARAGNFNDAFELYRAAWNHEGADVEARLDAAIGVGKHAIHVADDRLDEAIETLNQARSLAAAKGFRRRHAAATHYLAFIQMRRGDPAEASRLLDESPVLRLGDRPSRELAQHFHCRARLQGDQGKVIAAERIYYRAYQFYEETDYQPGIAAVCDSLANILLRNGRTEAALEFCQRSLKIKEQIGDRAGMAISLGTLGRICIHQAKYDEARSAFEMDLEIARELNDVRGIGQMLNSLGEVAWLQQAYDQAEASFRQSMSENDDAENVAHARVGLIHTHVARGEFDLADTEIGELDALLEDDSQVREREAFRLRLQGLRGSVLWRREHDDGKLQEGETLLRSAVSGLREKKHLLDTVPYLYELRDLYHRQGDLSKAVQAVAESLDVLSENGAERRVRDVEEWLERVDQPELTRLALERHVPQVVAKHIFQQGFVTPKPQKKHVAVLFSDVRGYTKLSEKSNPQVVVDLLNEWFSEVTRAIQSHGGYVDKFIGDAVMAVFDLPNPQDSSTAAVRSALDMSQALWAMNLRHGVLDKPSLRIGIGIAAGEVVVGFVGSHHRQTYTALGDAVNVASRLEGETKKHHGCEILISDDVEQHQRQCEIAETRFVGNLHLKGRDRPVTAYEVLGIRGDVIDEVPSAGVRE